MRPLRGWQVEELPDGTTCVTLPAWRRVATLAVAFLTVLLIARNLLRINRFPNFNIGPGAMQAGFTLLAGFFVVLVVITIVLMLLEARAGFSYFVWPALSRMQWRVGSDFMEVRRTFWGRQWAEQHTGGRLEITTGWDWIRGIRVQLVLDGLGRRHILWDASFWFFREIRTLGEYLAARTGWPLEGPSGVFMLNPFG
jgi:hypothetical protein